jgi:hypothetical protein
LHVVDPDDERRGRRERSHDPEHRERHGTLIRLRTSGLRAEQRGLQRSALDLREVRR